MKKDKYNSASTDKIYSVVYGKSNNGSSNGRDITPLQVNKGFGNGQNNANHIKSFNLSAMSNKSGKENQ